MSVVSNSLEQAEGNQKSQPKRWFLMFIVNGNNYDGDTYVSREIDLSRIRQSAEKFAREMQEKLDKEYDRVHKAYDNGIADPGCNIDIDGVFLANSDDDLAEYIPKGVPKHLRDYHWKVYSLKKNMIFKNDDGFAEEVSGLISKNVEEVITKELERRNRKSS